jgi:prolycopene isomerase
MIRDNISRRDFIKITAMTAAASLVDINSLNALTASVKDKGQYPVVVVGSGLGGLTCAAYLSKTGFPVTVLEQHHKPGGYATSFRRGDFTFEVSLHAMAASGNATHAIIKELGLLEKIELVRLEKSHRRISKGRDMMLPDRNPEAYIEMLSGFYPSEKQGIHSFVTEILEIQSEVYRLFQNKNQYTTITFPFQYPRMWGVRNKTLQDLLDDHVKNPNLKDDLGYLWGYYGLPPSKLSGFYYANSVADYLKNGSSYVKGQSQSLSDALVDIIKEHGGLVKPNTPVEEILVKNEAISGVITKGGEKIPASFVVSNASVPDTFGKLLSKDADASDYREKISAFRPSISSFCVWLGLKGNLRGNIPGCNIRVASTGSMEEAFRYALNCDADKMGYTVTVFDNYYQGYSAPEKSTVMITCLSGYQPWKGFEMDYLLNRKKAYHAAKSRIAGTLIHRAEKDVIPELSSMVEVMDAATPLTNLHYTRNPEGAIYGYEQAMNNQFMDRIKNHTPITGLYLAGAWGYPGGGFTGVMRGGLRTSRLIVESLA